MLNVERQEAGRHGPGTATTLLAAEISVLVGLVIGCSGPLFFIYIGAGFIAGPTWGGLVLLLALAAGALSFLVGGLFLLIGRRAGFAGTVFLISVAFTLGTFGGTTLGSATHVGGWALGPTPAPMPTFSFAPRPVLYQASGDVTLALDGITGFAQPSLEPFADGLFGHWCSSDPGEKTVSTIDTLEVGRINGETVRVELRLTDPGGQSAQWSITIPRVTITVADERGRVLDLWSGPGTVVESDESNGRLTFSDLPADLAYHSGSLPDTISGEVSWHCGAWQVAW